MLFWSFIYSSPSTVATDLIHRRKAQENINQNMNEEKDVEGTFLMFLRILDPSEKRRFAFTDTSHVFSLCFHRF